MLSGKIYPLREGVCWNGSQAGRWHVIGKCWLALCLPCEYTCLGYLKTIPLGNWFVVKLSSNEE